MSEREDVEARRRYLVGDLVRVIRGDYIGQTGKVARADYARRVPLLVDVSAPHGVGICYGDDWVELEAAVGDAEHCENTLLDALRAVHISATRTTARNFLASSWLAAHDEAVRVSERVRLAGEVEAP